MKIRQAFLDSLQVFNPTDRQSDFWALHRVRTRQRINKKFVSIKITCHLNTRVCTIPELSYMSNITQIMGRSEWMFCVGTQMLCSEYRLYSLGKDNLYSVICASYKKRYLMVLLAVDFLLASSTILEFTASDTVPNPKFYTSSFCGLAQFSQVGWRCQGVIAPDTNFAMWHDGFPAGATSFPGSGVSKANSTVENCFLSNAYISIDRQAQIKNS